MDRFNHKEQAGIMLLPVYFLFLCFLSYFLLRIEKNIGELKFYFLHLLPYAWIKSESLRTRPVARNLLLGGGKVDSWGATISVNGVKFLTTLFLLSPICQSVSQSVSQSAAVTTPPFLYMFSSQLPPAPSPKSSWGGGKLGQLGGQKPPAPLATGLLRTVRILKL
jgi:hypothetical protein